MTLPRSSLLVVLAGIVLGAVVLLHFGYGIPVGDMTREPAAILGFPLYLGFFSHLGVLLWTAAASVCLFAAALLARSPADRVLARFLAVTGLFTLVLALDDLFLLHEQAFPEYLGVPEGVVLSAYVLFTVFHLVRFRGILVRTEYRLLVAALGFFALALGADLVTLLLARQEARLSELPASTVDYYFLFEDGTKFAGITLWSVYLMNLSSAAVRASSPAESARRAHEHEGRS